MLLRLIRKGRIGPPIRIIEAGDGPRQAYEALKAEGIAEGYADLDNNGGLNEPKTINEDTRGILDGINTGNGPGADRTGGQRGGGGTVGGSSPSAREETTGGESGLGTTDSAPPTITVDDFLEIPGISTVELNAHQMQLYGEVGLKNRTPTKSNRCAIISSSSETRRRSVPLSARGRKLVCIRLPDQIPATNAPDQQDRGWRLSDLPNIHSLGLLGD